MSDNRRHEGNLVRRDGRGSRGEAALSAAARRGSTSGPREE